MAKEPLHLDFSDAETQRNRLSEAQAKSIRDLYREASKEVGKWAERAPRVPSDALRKEYLNKLQGEINRELRGIERQLDGTVRNNMTEVVQATVGDAKAFAQNFGLSIQGAYSHVPTDIVRAVASGQLYEGNWTLSRALWLNTVETQRDVQNIVAKGILENKSAYDIAKDLEKYVNPDARKDWDWSKVYPGTRKVIDYNAQRLARTMVSHAYQQAFVRTTQKNPFITKYEWRAADSERTCQLCMDRDGQYFPKDDLPLDHPNGMCTFLAVIEDDFNSIADRLADWAIGESDSALDEWAKDLYGSVTESAKQDIKIPWESVSSKMGIRPNNPSYARTVFNKIPGISDPFIQVNNQPIREFIRNMTPTRKSVTLDSLYTDQYTNKTQALKNMQQAFPTIKSLMEASQGKLTVARVNGMDILLDGNTRGTILQAYGVDSIEVLYYSVSGDVKITEN